MQNINEKVEVGFNVYPKWVKWKNRIHKIEKLGLHHTYREGKTLYHVFSVATKTSFMRLILDTETLNWKLTNIENEI